MAPDCTASVVRTAADGDGTASEVRMVPDGTASEVRAAEVGAGTASDARIAPDGTASEVRTAADGDGTASEPRGSTGSTVRMVPDGVAAVDADDTGRTASTPPAGRENVVRAADGSDGPASGSTGAGGGTSDFADFRRRPAGLLQRLPGAYP